MNCAVSIPVFYDLKRTGMLKDASYLKKSSGLAQFFKPEYGLRLSPLILLRLWKAEGNVSESGMIEKQRENVATSRLLKKILLGSLLQIGIYFNVTIGYMPIFLIRVQELHRGENCCRGM